MATEDDIRLQQLMDREIPSSRQALKDSHRNLAELASYCEANYVDCTDKATALEETKKYAIQSLASVAYQINMLATNVMQMLEIQTEQLGHMESNLNHLDQSVGNYKENVARRKVGSLAISKHLTKTPLKVAAPLEPEKPQRYKRVPIDYGILDDIGHGVKPNNDVGRLFQGGRRESNTSLRSQKNNGSMRSNVSAPRPPIAPMAPPAPTPPTAPVSSSLCDSVGNLFALPPPPPPPGLPPSGPSNASPPPPPPPPPQQQQQQQQAGAPFPPPLASAVGTPPPPPPPPPTVAATPPTGSGPAPPPPPLGSVPPPPPPPFPGSSSKPVEVKPQPKPKVEPDPVNPAVMVAEIARKRQQRMAAQQQGQEPDGTAAVNNGVVKVAPPVSTKPPKARERESIQVEPVEESREDKHREEFSTVADSGSNESREPSWAPKEYIHKVETIYPYTKDRDDELSFQEGTIIYVIRLNDDGWWEGVMEGGVTGLFPGNYAEILGSSV